MSGRPNISLHEDLLCAALRGERPDWPRGIDTADVKSFLDAARYHGALQLLAAAFNDRRLSDSWPEEIRTTCREQALAQAMFELAHRAEMMRVLDAFASIGVKASGPQGHGVGLQPLPEPGAAPARRHRSADSAACGA